MSPLVMKHCLVKQQQIERLKTLSEMPFQSKPSGRLK